MRLVDKDKLQNISATVAVGQALFDTELLAAARNYKKFTSSRYRLMSEGDINSIESKKLYASLKLDGQLHFLFKKGKECFLYNCKGRVITGLLCLDEAASILAQYDSVLLAGELYLQRPDERARVFAVSAALGQGAVGVDELAFAAFDVLALDGETYQKTTAERNEKLASMLPAEGKLHHINARRVDLIELARLYNTWVVEGGEEGIVCIDEEQHSVYKIKPRHNVDAVILGFTELSDTPDSLRVLLTGLMRPDGSFQVFAKVGTGFDDAQRREICRILKPLAVASSFNVTDSKHALFTMVKPHIVIEMAFHDLIYEDNQGRPQLKPVLLFDEAKGFSPQVPEAFVSVLGPVFKRIRDDKHVNPVDLRLTQLSDWVDLDNLEQKARKIDLVKSTLLRRDVYTKTVKGLVSVRKFICWKTNKEELDDSFPAFVFVYVDFSPARQAPLKRELKIAQTEGNILAIYEQFLGTEVKRGWANAIA